MTTSDQGRWLGLLQSVAEHLAARASVDEVGATVVTFVREAIGASASTLTTLTPDMAHLEVVASTGMSEETMRLTAAPVPLDTSPVSLALARGEAVVFESIADRDRQFPMWAGWPTTREAWLVLPMIARGQHVGAVSFGWDDPRTFGQDEVAFASAIAHQAALAVDRARALQAEARQRAVLELLSEGSRLMLSSLTPSVVIERLTEIAVPRLADWCGVYLAEGDQLVPAALTVRDRDESPRLLPQSDPIPLAGTTGMARCFATGQAVFVGTIDDASAMASGQVTADALRDRPIRSGVAMPIVARDQRLGVLMLGFADPRAYDDELRYATEGLAARAGIALDNARRFQDERRVARSLTAALVPDLLPPIAGYSVAARYLPAGDPVAGDWHDVLALSNGTYLVGIGDVAGHGVTAAADMAELRNAARGIAMAVPDISTIMEALAGLGSRRADLFATAGYGILDPDGRLRWISAGHLPVIAFDEVGHAWATGEATMPPLGFSAGAVPVPAELKIGPGGGLVLLTDGVIERRGGPDLRRALADVSELVAGLAHMAADKIADAVVDAFCLGAEDDCCVLVLKRQ